MENKQKPYGEEREKNIICHQLKKGEPKIGGRLCTPQMQANIYAFKEAC
jgi:hypothetical protein